MSAPYNFGESVREWSAPPADIGNFHSNQLANLSDNELRIFIQRVEHERYSGWRNYGNKWREFFGLDSTRDKKILDFGCGFGIEALQFLRRGNRVTIADISQSNLIAAERILNAEGFKPHEILLITEKAPFYLTQSEFDIFYANGVLHHIPYAVEILERALQMLAPNGEVRLLLYSDVAWWNATGTVPECGEVHLHPQWPIFVRTMDAVGHYADWYDRRKIEERFGRLWEISGMQYLTPNHNYLGVKLIKRLASESDA